MWKVFASNKVRWIVIGLAVTWFVANQAEMGFVWRDIAALEQKSFFPGEARPGSVTGFQFEQRRELLTPDGYHWAMQTQRMLAEGDLRVRKADYDNQPGGREVHWSSVVRRWLGGLAWLWSLVWGSPLPVAVEEVALWANPLLLLASMSVLVPWLWRWAGDADGMRDQVRRCLEVADEATLRRLNINSLICLVLYAEGTGEAGAYPEIARLAAGLVPAELLKQARASSGR